MTRNQNSRTSRARQIGFRLCAVLIAIMLLEMGSYLILVLVHGGMAHVSEERSSAALRTQGSGRVQQVSVDMVHPYVGFVRQPPTDSLHAQPPVTDFGFPDVASPLHKRASDKVIVGIVGGSVAEQFAVLSSDLLADELGKSPEFVGKDIVIVRLALSGHKQPQQLMILNYLLSLGAEFDMLINIDGFNEVALPVSENVPNRVFAAFPRSWHTRVADTANPDVLRIVGHMTHLRLAQQRTATRFASWPTRYSASMTLLWKSLHSANLRALTRDRERLSSLSRSLVNAYATGPSQDFAGDSELYAHCVEVWSRSSVLINDLCTAKGIRYFHFLQPNQYVPDSKPMGVQESAIAINLDQPYRVPVIKGYPRLIEEGATLTVNGVQFHDLSQLFRDVPEVMYVDDCCHINKQGNDMMARAIAQFMTDAAGSARNRDPDNSAQ